MKTNIKRRILGIFAAVAIPLIIRICSLYTFPFDAAKQIQIDSETPRQASIKVNDLTEYANPYCYEVAQGIAYTVCDNGYPIIIAGGDNKGREGKNGAFSHYIFAFQEKGLWGCADNGPFGYYVRPQYETLNDLFEDCAKKYGRFKGVKCNEILTKKDLPKKRLKKALEFLL